MSDHFDGNRFFNPTLPKGFAPSRRSVIKMLLEPRSRWPAWVENKGVPRLNEMLGTDEVAITFVNHATFLIQTRRITILTDPVWSERASPLRWIGPKRVRKPGVSFEGLPAIDIILLSHNHYDHMPRTTRNFRLTWPHSGRDSRSSGGRKAAISDSTFAGGRSMTRN